MIFAGIAPAIGGVVIAIVVLGYVVYGLVWMARLACPKCDGKVAYRFRRANDGTGEDILCVCCKNCGGWEKQGGDWAWRFRTAEEFWQFFNQAT